MRQKQIALQYSQITGRVYAQVKNSAGRNLGDPIDITMIFLGAMVSILRERGGAMVIKEQHDLNGDPASIFPLGANPKVSVQVKLGGMVNRRIKIQIVEDVLVEGEPKETPAGKDGGV